MCSERMRHVCLLLLGVLAACSIREDRSECPCILVADFTALDAGTLSGAGYTLFR